jgi:hypothetical protein
MHEYTDPAPSNSRPATEVPDRDRSHSPLLDEMVQAMQTAAARERERLTALLADDRKAHDESVRTSAAAEADDLVRVADRDIERIREWADAEIGRIRAQADGRVAVRRERLEQHATAHVAIVAEERRRVDDAVAAYQSDLDRYFEQIAAEDTPGGIARLAEQLPPPFDIDSLSAAARADTVARLSSLDDPPTDDSGPAAPIAVMDPDLARTGAEVAEVRATEPVTAGGSTPDEAATVAVIGAPGGYAGSAAVRIIRTLTRTPATQNGHNPPGS